MTTCNSHLWLCFPFFSNFVQAGLVIEEKYTCASQCDAVCCSVLQCVAVCCSVLQCGDRGRTHFCVAVCCSVLQCVAVCCSVLQCVLHYVAVCCSMCCSTLQCVAVCCSVLQCHGTFVLQVAVMALSCCRLQCVAVCRSVLLSSVVAARLILRSLLRGQTVRGLTTQKNPAKNPATLEQPRKEPCNTGATPQRTLQHWSNPASMGTGQLCVARKFGHRAVRGQMALEAHV